MEVIKKIFMSQSFNVGLLPLFLMSVVLFGDLSAAKKDRNFKQSRKTPQASEGGLKARKKHKFPLLEQRSPIKRQRRIIVSDNEGSSIEFEPDGDASTTVVDSVQINEIPPQFEQATTPESNVEITDTEDEPPVKSEYGFKKRKKRIRLDKNVEDVPGELSDSETDTEDEQDLEREYDLRSCRQKPQGRWSKIIRTMNEFLVGKLQDRMNGDFAFEPESTQITQADIEEAKSLIQQMLAAEQAQTVEETAETEDEMQVDSESPIKYPWLTSLNDKIKDLCNFADRSYYKSLWYRWSGHALQGSLLALYGRWIFLAVDSALFLIKNRIAANLEKGGMQDYDSYTILYYAYNSLEALHASILLVLGFQSGMLTYFFTTAASVFSFSTMLLTNPNLDERNELQRLQHNIGRLLQILIDIWIKYNQANNLKSMNFAAFSNQHFPCQTFISNNGTALEACPSGFHPFDTITHFREGGFAQRCFVKDNTHLICTLCNPDGLCLQANAVISSIENLVRSHNSSFLIIKLLDKYFVETQECFCVEGEPTCNIRCHFQPLPPTIPNKLLPTTMPNKCEFEAPLNQEAWEKEQGQIHGNISLEERTQRNLQRLVSHTSLKTHPILKFRELSVLGRYIAHNQTIFLAISTAETKWGFDLLGHELGHAIQFYVRHKTSTSNSISSNEEIIADLLSGLMTENPKSLADLFAAFNYVTRGEAIEGDVHPQHGTRCVYLRELAEIYKAIQKYFQQYEHLLLP